MIKLFKKTLLFISVIIIIGCSYEPIYLKKNYNFSIVNIDFIGDEKINSILKRQFDNRLQIDLEKKYYLVINSTKEKKVVSKDSKGDPSQFELIISTEYWVYKDANEKNLLITKLITKKNIYNSISDKFKLEKSEDIVIQNLSEKIADDITLSIANINDN
tara:strand:- start:504 stop:983 length:480 start_codon:yes stop_codon:yes gene_type:complete